MRLAGAAASGLEVRQCLGVLLPAVLHEADAPAGFVGVVAVGVAGCQLSIQLFGEVEMAVALRRLGRLPQGVVGELMARECTHEAGVGIDRFPFLIQPNLDATDAVEGGGAAVFVEQALESGARADVFAALQVTAGQEVPRLLRDGVIGLAA